MVDQTTKKLLRPQGTSSVLSEVRDAKRYHTFEETWYYPAHIENVWSALASIDSTSGAWMRGAFVARPLAKYTGPAIGNAYAVSVRGFLPYTLRLVFELAQLKFPIEIGLRIDGDLTGNAELRLESAANGTHLKTTETVFIQKRPLCWLVPHPTWLFAWQHRWALKQGQRAVMTMFAQSGLLIEQEQKSRTKEVTIFSGHSQ